ncbi:TPA: type VI secretion system protein TssL, short form [Providencia rettgeri]|nr:type VI secretion system protein TssL, short form [Providencia rettgeri]
MQRSDVACYLMDQKNKLGYFFMASFYTEQQTINNILTDIELMVCQLQQGCLIHDGKAFYHAVCHQIEQTVHALSEAGIEQTSIEHIQYALCAMLDENVMNRRIQDSGISAWLQSPLQTRYFNTLDAGHTFWERLQSILSSPSPNTLVLVCFHRVLTLGFVGKYRQVDAPEREQLIAQLNARLPHHAITYELPLATKAKLRVSPRRLYWISWIGGGLLLTALWWGLSTSLEHLLQQWMMQGQ